VAHALQLDAVANKMQSTEQDDKQQPLLENQRYKKTQTLGKGAFGFVQLAEDTTAKEKVAIKFLARGEKVNKYVERELLIHRILKHPHVIQFREVFLTSEYLCIAMEYASGGTLFSFVQSAGRLKEVVARWFFQQLIIGVDYCHKVSSALPGLLTATLHLHRYLGHWGAVRLPLCTASRLAALMRAVLMCSPTQQQQMSRTSNSEPQVTGARAAAAPVEAEVLS
jgi:hypothetical protein